MTITASVLFDLVHCPQRVALDAFGDQKFRDPVNPFVQLLWERGTLFERETIEKLNTSFTDLSTTNATERESRTLEAMRRGDELIYGGRIGSDDLLGEPDILRKEGDGYIPGDIKSGSGEEGGDEENDGKPKLHYAVQLALYVDILERIKLSCGRKAFVWDINGEEIIYDLATARGPKTPESLWDVYDRILADARDILGKNEIPKPALASACKTCHWHTFCVEQLIKEDDLTLIHFLGRKKRDVMQSSLGTVAEFAASNPDTFIDGKKTRFAGIGIDSLRTFHSRAVLLKQNLPKPYLKSVVQLPVTPVDLFFDIEVDSMRDIVYLHGFVERRNSQNDTEKFIYYFADDLTQKAERDAFANALTYMAGQTDAAIYYYSKYERTQYRKLQRKYPDVCSPNDIEALFAPTRAIDLLYDVVAKATEWPTYDHSIKTLAKYLGFQWRDTHPSGAASIEWFHRWIAERDPTVKQRILDYNEDDCRATRVLLDAIRSMAA